MKDADEAESRRARTFTRSVSSDIVETHEGQPERQKPTDGGFNCDRTNEYPGQELYISGSKDQQMDELSHD